MKHWFPALLAALLFSTGALAANPQVEIRTSMGVITVELYPDRAPKTVNNFLGYVKSGQYNGTIFHRVIAGFMIQGGGFDTGFNEKPTGAPIPNEAANGLKNEVGTVAMARTADPDSATAQFFINVVDNAGLDYPRPDGFGYAVFGKVVKGMDVVNQIAAVQTGPRPPYDDVPLTPVVIENVKLLSAKK
ncbi:MAG TPA: peptidylprolyl isomerase [Burkholderiales bacterium]|nr:peptidylprolyl isomerase [Burkholderiales bacterium]